MITDRLEICKGFKRKQNITAPKEFFNGPGELPREYLFIAKSNQRTRIGEFVYYKPKYDG